MFNLTDYELYKLKLDHIVENTLLMKSTILVYDGRPLVNKDDVLLQIKERNEEFERRYGVSIRY